MEIIEDMLYFATENKNVVRLDLTKLKKEIDDGVSQGNRTCETEVCKDAEVICSDGKDIGVLSPSGELFELKDCSIRVSLDYSAEKVDCWTAVAKRGSLMVSAGFKIADKSILYTLVNMSTKQITSSLKVIKNPNFASHHLRVVEVNS